MLLEKLLEGLLQALQLTVFVLFIMMLMEYFSLKKTKGVSVFQKKKTLWMYVYAVLLGCVPGCVGGFAAMSFYTHGFWSFGAVLSSSFTSLGDDTFRMWVECPKDYIYMTLGLLVLGLIFGILIDRLNFFKKLKSPSNNHIHSHKEDEATGGGMAGGVVAASTSGEADAAGVAVSTEHEHEHSHEHSHNALERYLWLFLIAIYIFSLFFIGHDHGDSASCACSSHSHSHSSAERGLEILHLFIENGLFLILSLVCFWVILRCDMHFIVHHLRKHVFKEHFLSIFIWTLATLYAIVFYEYFFGSFNYLLKDGSSYFILLLAAVLIGWIPYSGPHYLFIHLYAIGALPFGIFLSNSIVQDGHTSLVLLSESGRQFSILKATKSVIALVLGSAFYFLVV